LATVVTESLWIDEIVVADDADAWRAAGFDVDGDGCVQVATVRLRCIGAGEGRADSSDRRADSSDGRADSSDGRAGRGIRSWVIGGVSTAMIDGLDGRLTDPIPVRSGTAHPNTGHPNTSVELDHVVVATPDIDRTIGAFVAAARRPRR